MNISNTQISAYISIETKTLVEQYVKSRGIKKAFLVESALLHHLQALKELPIDIVIPPRIMVSRKSGDAIMELLENPVLPTEDMKAIFKDD
ncbi:MAG: hypothetical protein U9R43_14810 [Thermodesulfobacteriota bacterium]|nr:hypothetical protein [Thermodesulfobacteriota bacterium]